MSTLKLTSNEGDERTLSTNAFKRSSFLSKNTNQPSPFKVEVNTKTLDLVIDYLNEYANKDPQPIPAVLGSADLRKEIKSDFDYKLVANQTFETVFHLINAAAQFELDHLHDLACARIASFMKDKSPEDVNKEFTIECQLTAEEAKELGLEVGDDAKEG